MNKKFSRNFSIISLFLLSFFAVSVNNQKAEADAGLTLGILGTVFGGTALLNQVFGCGGANCGGRAVYYPMPTSGGGCCGGGGYCGASVGFDCAPVYPSMVPSPPAPAPQASPCSTCGNTIVNVYGASPMPTVQQMPIMPMPTQRAVVRGLW